MVALFRRPASFASVLFTVRRVAAFSSSVVSAPTVFARSQSNHAACRYASTLTMMTSGNGSFEVAQFPCLSDNYGYLIHNPVTGETAAIDTPDATAYKQELEKRGWTLTHILNTHHHGDHVGGNSELKTNGVKVYGPANDGNIPGMDHPLSGEETFHFGGAEARVIDVGGHTMGHIAYYFPEEKTAFVGDSLFALGCGRMFEGTAPQFWSSLKRLRDLPDDTTMFCAHEYTEANARYAMSVEPGNELLVKRVEEIQQKRSRGEPTVPSLLGEEKLTNPFLRGDVSDEIKKNIGATSDEDDAKIFLKIRQGKDNFRG